MTGSEPAAPEHGQPHQPGAVANRPLEIGRYPKGQACLANPARSNEDNQAAGGEGGFDLLQLAASADEARQLGR